MLVWITGTSGAGKSTTSAELERRGYRSVDADWDGYCRWTSRATGEVVQNAPDPVPPGWLHKYGWTIDRAKVERLAAASHNSVTFLCATVENEVEVADLFDLVVCLAIDDVTLRHRLLTRTTNSFGRNPEELAAALEHNAQSERAYRRHGAAIVHAGQPVTTVADLIVERVVRFHRSV